MSESVHRESRLSLEYAVRPESTKPDAWRLDCRESAAPLINSTVRAGNLYPPPKYTGWLRCKTCACPHHSPGATTHRPAPSTPAATCARTCSWRCGMNSDSQFIIKWSERMMKVTGMCGAALCEAVFYASGGEETPGHDATPESVEVARMWEAAPNLIGAYIARDGRWCMRPTIGCRMAQSKPCKHINAPMGVTVGGATP